MDAARRTGFADFGVHDATTVEGNVRRGFLAASVSLSASPEKAKRKKTKWWRNLFKKLVQCVTVARQVVTYKSLCGSIIKDWQ